MVDLSRTMEAKFEWSNNNYTIKCLLHFCTDEEYEERGHLACCSHPIYIATFGREAQ